MRGLVAHAVALAAHAIPDSPKCEVTIQSITGNWEDSLLRPAWQFPVEQFSTDRYRQFLSKEINRLFQQGKTAERKRWRFWNKMARELTRQKQAFIKDNLANQDQVKVRLLKHLQIHEQEVRDLLTRSDQYFLLLQQSSLGREPSRKSTHATSWLQMIQLLTGETTELARIYSFHQGLSAIWSRRESQGETFSLLKGWQNILTAQ